MARWRVLSVVFHVFYLNLMPFSMPGKLQKGLSLSPVSPNFGRVTRLMNPISLPSIPQNSTSAPLFRCPEPPFPHTPNHHLGCPISPFGMSHFAFWGIFSAHLRTTYSPDARFGFFVFAAKACAFSFQYKKIDPLILLQKYLYSIWKKKEKVLYLCTIISKQTRK